MTECIQIPPKIYFKPGCTAVALRELREIYGRKCVFLAAGEKNRRAASYADGLLRKQGLRTAKAAVADFPLPEAEQAALLSKFRELQPDAIMGVGGKTALAAARWLWEKSAGKQDILLVLVAAESGSGQNISAAAGKPSLLPQISITDPLLFEQASAEALRTESEILLNAGIRAWCALETTEFGESFLLEAISLSRQIVQSPKKNSPALRAKRADAAALYELGTGTAAPEISAPLTADEKETFRPRLDRLATLLD